jgi:hypothetical protein
MTAQQSAQKTAHIRKWLLLLLLGAMFIALLEVRFEHQAILGEKPQAWIPLAYCGFMLVAIPVGLATKNTFGVRFLVSSFIGLAVVGLMGVWFHAGQKPDVRISAIIKTATSTPGEMVATDDDSGAPLLAPFALFGLGAMGVLISLLPFKAE